MAFEITSAADEVTLQTYTAARNKVRDLITYGVYPHVQQALDAYDELDDVITALAAGTANEQALATYHGVLIADASDDIDDLRTYGANVIASIEAIETAVPGTFDIVVT